MRKLSALLIGVLLVGLGDSMGQPYLVLFGVDRVGVSVFQVGLLFSVYAAGGVVISVWLGRRYDRNPSRWPVLVAVLAPAAGYVVVAGTTSYALLLVLCLTVLGAGAAGFPQMFALARGHLGESSRGTPALRAMWSVAWAIGPLAGAALLSRYGYPGLFLGSAAAFACVAVPVLLLGRTPAPERPDDGSPPVETSSRPLMLPAVAFTFFHTALFAGGVVLPLLVTRSLDRPNGDVGLLFSVCAVVEIPASLVLIGLPARANRMRLMLAGMSLQVVYFALTAVSVNLAMLIGAQVARGVAIAVTVAIGITYFQERLPGAAGRATTLFANTATVGSLIAGVLGGSAAQLLGYRPALVVCGVVGAAAVVVMAAAGRPQASKTENSTSSAAPARQP